eukprot:6459842-Amphidinium_carterae.1
MRSSRSALIWNPGSPASTPKSVVNDTICETYFAKLCSEGNSRMVACANAWMTCSMLLCPHSIVTQTSSQS